MKIIAYRYDFLFLYSMNNDENIKIDWLSERQEDDIYRTISNIRSSLIGMYMSFYGDDINNIIPTENEDNLIEFKNFIIQDSRSNEYSNLSAEGAIAMLYRDDDYFIIPPDLIKYIQDNIGSSIVFDYYEEKFPHNIQELYMGKDLFDTLRSLKFPRQSAYMLCGMIFSKSKWDPTYFDVYENNKDWTRRKEGLLGINKWPDKKKIIEALNLNHSASFAVNTNVKSITTNETKYNTAKHGLLSMLDLNSWVSILCYIIQNSEKNGGDDRTLLDYLNYDRKPKKRNDLEDDDHKLLYAAYLLNEAKDYSKTFESIEEKIDKNKEEEKLNTNKSYNEIPNDFIVSLLVAKILSQFCCGVPVDDLNLLDIFPSFGQLSMMNFEGSFESKTYKGSGKNIPIVPEKPNAKGITVVNQTQFMFKRTSTIQYIILHYSASTTSGKNNAMNTLRTLNTRELSSDFAVDDNLIIQLADDITKWASTAVQRWSSSGTPAGKNANNNNSVSIEMSSTLGEGGQYRPNDPHFYFTNEVLANTRYLCKLLVKEFNIPPERVIRHYDIMGKCCPGIRGWNLGKGSDNDNLYREFVASIFDGEEVGPPANIINKDLTDEMSSKQNNTQESDTGFKTWGTDKMPFKINAF